MTCEELRVGIYVLEWVDVVTKPVQTDLMHDLLLDQGLRLWIAALEEGCEFAEPRKP
ncbi:hypothetical protein [Natronosalvus rutilus]|uniref:Uncharacterized protein n=1 Tax=Natronosalvus rutilus TaxID=2953753 RepID=A0A9E7N9Y8_9EURY|nr:hypothetical protein [Natronosalvus rutilus]UTF52822.1 hypothetical protein NGM29_13675 [Natronosalvus rutilus]